MKNTSLILSIIAFVAAAVFGILYLTGNGKNNAADECCQEATAAKGEIVYFNLDRVLQEYDMANELRSVVETKVEGINAEVNRRGKKLENDIKAFQDKVNKGLLTRTVAETQGAKLQQQEQDFNNYAAQKQQEIMEEQQVMMNQLADAIQTWISAYNEKMHYGMIIANQQSSPVIAADTALDITDAVVAGLNEEYVSTKNAKPEE